MNISKKTVLFVALAIFTVSSLFFALDYAVSPSEKVVYAIPDEVKTNRSGQFMTHQEVIEMQDRHWESGYSSGFYDANNAHYSHARYPDYDNVSKLDYTINGTDHYTDLNGYHYAYNNGYSMYGPVLDDVDISKKDSQIQVEYRCTNSKFSTPLQYCIITKYDDKHRIHSFTLNSSESFKDSFTLNPQSTEILLFSSICGHIYKKSLTTEIILNTTKIR